MNVLENIEPIQVFNYFEEISRIPRGSGNEKAISDYIVAFAKERNLEVYQDNLNNVIIKKQATKGYENAPTVIIQGHMDMVCEKNMGTEHDFLKDPLKLKVDGDFVSAEGTTLGADNGIAVAYGLALLDSADIQHPPLEIVITTDEETGMSGALGLNMSQLSGRYLINIDSDTEGELCVSCAGGLKALISLDLEYKETNYDTGVKIIIKGLFGGHSGTEIDKNRANSNMLLGRLVNELNKKIDYDITDIGGGLKDNAIPREAFASIIIDNKNLSQVKTIVNDLKKVSNNEYNSADPNIDIVIEEIETNKKVFSKDCKNKILFLLLNLPNGIQTMSADIEGLVQSSLNLGVVVRDNNTLKFIFAVRSSVKTLKSLLKDKLESMANIVGAVYESTSEYPGWEYVVNSKLQKLFEETYETMYNKKATIKAIHAGMECGIFAEQIEGIELISFGPNMQDIHTPDEKLSISSTKNTWEYLLKVLENFKDI